jgi:hypothetical protein
MLDDFRRLLLEIPGRLMLCHIRRQLAAFQSAAQDPRRVQEGLRRRILADAADTDFGRDHHFAGLRTRDDFRRAVPVAGYEYLRPYVECVRHGHVRALLPEGPVRMFALTSGTTAARKFIPVTDRYLADYRRVWHVWGARLYADHPASWLRPIVQLSGDWDECRSPSGVPCGSVTGLTAITQKRFVRWLYSVPACAGRVQDAAAKYYLALRLSLPAQPGLILAANPSTLLNLARAGDARKEALIRDLADGTLAEGLDIPAEVRAALRPVLRRRHARRARELEAIVRRTGTLYPGDYWPRHCVVGTWTGGSLGAYLRQLPRYYGDMPVRDPGLIASEGRMTIPLEDGTSSGVLDVTSHYFEFIPEAEAERPRPAVLEAHELEEGRNYFILLTTAYGLYRYHIHDLVRVTGFYGRTPLLEFLGKGAHFANVTGEKLSEYQVVRAVADVLDELGLALTTYSLAPCWDDERPHYGLFVERGDCGAGARGVALAERLDRRLAEVNSEYAGKRRSRRLGPVRLELLPPGAWQQWDQQRRARAGGVLEQYKHPCLIGDLDFRKTMPVDEEVSPGGEW